MRTGIRAGLVGIAAFLLASMLGGCIVVDRDHHHHHHYHQDRAKECALCVPAAAPAAPAAPGVA